MRKIKINKKLIIILVLILVLVPATAHAQSIDISDALTTFLRNLAAFLQTTLLLLQKLLWPVLLMIGGLLGNDLLFSSGMEDRLLSIWVQVRNIVNIGFVVILVGLALINVLGIEDEKFSLKSILPKFIIGLIAVNFSFIAMKIVLDVTNVLTVAVFAMPASIETKLGYTGLIPDIGDNFHVDEYLSEMDKDQKKKMLSICRNLFGEAKDYKPPKQDPKKPTAEVICTVNENKQWQYTQRGIDYFNKFNSRNAAMILAIQMMNINQLDEVSNIFVEEKDTKGNVTKVTFDINKLTFNLLFNVILYVVYGSAYVALLAVLLTRLVVLWVLIAVSPVFAIQLVLPNLIGSGGDMKEKFINNTFAPIMIAIPLTIGYMMLDAYKNVATDKGAVQVLGNSAKVLQIDASGIGDLQRLVMAIGTVAVVWMGVFIYAGKSMAGPLTDFIKQKVQGFGGRVVGLAKYVPLIPGKRGEEKMSIAETMALAEKPLLEMERAGRNKVAAITGEWRNPRALRGITSFQGAKDILVKHRETLHEKAQSSAFAEALERLRKQGKTAELEKFFPTAVRRQVFGTSDIDEIIKTFKKGGYNRSTIQQWLGRINISSAGFAGGAAAKTTAPRATAAPLSTMNKGLASTHGLGARNGSKTTGMTNEELKIAVDGNGTELNAISTAVRNYDETKPATVAALKTALAAYSRKLKGKKTADGKAFKRVKDCVDDVLKKAASKHVKDYGKMSKHIPT